MSPAVYARKARAVGALACLARDILHHVEQTRAFCDDRLYRYCDTLERWAVDNAVRTASATRELDAAISTVLTPSCPADIARAFFLLADLRAYASKTDSGATTIERIARDRSALFARVLVTDGEDPRAAHQRCDLGFYDHLRRIEETRR